MKNLKLILLTSMATGVAMAQLNTAVACSAISSVQRTPVIELYTSEGCSSCPPADKWATGLKDAASKGQAVVQAFHVGYWDYIGWVDRFAMPEYTQRQHEVAAKNKLSGIYTPQLVRDGVDWPRWGGALSAKTEPAKVQIAMERNANREIVVNVKPIASSASGVGSEPVVSWTAYWTVTEHGHSSRVKSGENAGEFLQHDFVVRHYQVLGERTGAANFTLPAVAASPNPRQVNLVVSDKASGRVLQGLSLTCS